MDDFPPCETCGAESVVVVNGRSACGGHLDDAMRQAFEPLRTLRAELSKEPSDVTR